MNIIINGASIGENMEEAANLEDVLVKLSRGKLPEDHLVGTVKVNGREFSELYPGQSQEVVVEKINDLEITTVSLEKFAAAAINDCTVFLVRLVESVQKTAELFRMSDETVANEYFAKVVETIRALLQFIETTRKTVDWNFQTSMYNGKPIQEEWDRLLEVVDELHEIQEESDWILLADILEYEFVPALNRWKEIIGEKALNYERCASN